MKPLLRVEDLSVSFRTEHGRNTALQRISFEVRRGEVLAIVGESGSGKSVTALSVLRLLPEPPAAVDGGRILFSRDGMNETDLLGKDIREMGEWRGASISMIFQEPMTSLNPVMTCGEQVAEAIRHHGGDTRREAMEKTIALFGKVKLPSPEAIFKRYPHQLSGGQKQRVMIAMAMSCRPDLLIADEPTTALDVTVQKTILQLIRELQQEGDMGVLFITHDLGVVAELADRVMVMYRGSIVEEGPVERVLTSPAHPYTRALLACRPGLHPRRSRLPVVSDFMDEPGTGKPGARTIAPPAPPLNTDTDREADPVLRVQDLQVWFPGPRGAAPVKAVDDVSFDVQAGETLGLVGESGCGKTTLGRALLGLIKPRNGRILFAGKDLAKFSVKEWKASRKDIQIVFQDPYGSLNPRLTVGSAITEPMAVHGIFSNERQRREKVVELLEKVNLRADHFNRYPHEFSGGQRQRIGIARALALNPGFIIFDESVSALDVSVQAQVLNLLNDLRSEYGFTSVFISHDLSVVNYISDRILVMRQGRIVESGTADDIFSNPKENYTRELLEAIPGGRLRLNSGGR